MLLFIAKYEGDDVGQGAIPLVGMKAEGTLDPSPRAFGRRLFGLSFSIYLSGYSLAERHCLCIL